MRVHRIWIGILAALLLPYVVTLAWSGGVNGTDKSGFGEGGALWMRQEEGEDSGKRIYINNGQKGYVDVETYLVGIVARQIPAEYEPEAIKAQAIIARTYIYGKMEGKTEAAEAA